MMDAITTSAGIELRSLITNTVVARLEDSRNIEGSGVFSSDGHTFAVAVDGGAKILMWGVGGGNALGKPLERQAGGLLNVALSPDGQMVAGGGNDGNIQIWRTGDGQPLALLQSHGQEVRSVVFSKDGKLLAAASADGFIKFWEIVRK
jgi:WD40 repeat protein